MDQFTSTSKPSRRNLSTENSSESKMQKLKNNKKTKRAKRETRRTSLCGKQPNPRNPSGLHRGAKADLAGISNVQRWQSQSWGKRWTSTQEVLT